jgi:hypothetical protein
MKNLLDGVRCHGDPPDPRDTISVRPPPHRGTRWIFTAALGAAMLLAGCKAVDPPPEGLDDLFHYYWGHHEAGVDEELALALINFNDLVETDFDFTVEDVYDGSLTDITQDELDLVGMRADAVPTENAGMYLVNSFQCTISQLEQIVYALNQGSLYDDAYDHYERSYTSDFDVYVARDEPHLTWLSNIDATLMGASYHEDVWGDLRFVPDLGDADSPWGSFVVARYHMPEEASFSNADFFFTQDYQIEIFYEPVAGEIIHLYGLWRNMGFGTASTDDESIQRLILNGLADWDDRTEELCNSGQF